MLKAYHVLKSITDLVNIEFERYGQPFLRPYKLYTISLGIVTCDVDDDDMWTFVKDWTLNIEVNYTTKNNEEILTSVYFPFDPKVYSRQIILATFYNK